MDKQKILENFIAGMGASQNKHYIRMVQGFLNYATALDRDNVLRYTSMLQKQGYAAGTIEIRQRTIRSAFKRNDVPWPLKHGENAQIPESEEEAKALSRPTIERMIAGAKAGKLDVVSTWLLAASTVYGVRREELAGITPARINIKNRSVYVQTAKNGRERYHLLPDEILPICEQALPYIADITPKYVSKTFLKIEEDLGITHIPETGWHSIRRSLTHHLIESGVTEFATHEFLRWKRSRTNMVERYHNVRFVGIDIDGADIGRDRMQDEAVFRLHPFLPYWRGDVPDAT